MYGEEMTLSEKLAFCRFELAEARDTVYGSYNYCKEPVGTCRECPVKAECDVWEDLVNCQAAIKKKIKRHEE